MKYSYALTLSTIVLGVAAAPAVQQPGQGTHVARAQHGYFDFLRHVSRRDDHEGDKETSQYKTEKPQTDGSAYKSDKEDKSSSESENKDKENSAYKSDKEDKEKSAESGKKDKEASSDYKTEKPKTDKEDKDKSADKSDKENKDKEASSDYKTEKPKTDKENKDKSADKENKDKSADKENKDKSADKEDKDGSAYKSGSEEKPSKTEKEKSKTSKGDKSIITSAPTTGGGSGSGGSYKPSAPGNGTTTPGSGTVGDMPTPAGKVVLKAAQVIAAGQSFDGENKQYDRGVSCTGQAEGGDSDAVFILEKGAKLSNVIIGPDQIEGVHCMGGCTLENVWWSAVCEDAFTVKKQDAGETTTITGGGASGAEDKVIQHNGAGTISISGFKVTNFGKLYRACGNCKTSAERHVIFNNIEATDGKLLAGINTNFGDTATFTNVKASGVKNVCTEFEGVASGNEPTEKSSGPSAACKYSAASVVAAAA
ncbi:putative pectate lyase D [Colletotrichum orbiculare MAFF 240422]|uniref:Probable pectate lyase F n=1 Tax=Colletotrichum orbiculare (strain 104-T / ATCC 96160 / CBS 514.97 / LARS 414 / MAFF 240422) TaxID=1213857 RepID=N4VGC5_COLOR|nr:putative pectate lyase D [Colletotrichum orbiculare MAFF 240422]